jgi:hypothetical protein
MVVAKLALKRNFDSGTKVKHQNDYEYLNKLNKNKV